MNKTDRFLKWFFGDTLFECIKKRSFRGIMCEPITAMLLVVGTTMSAISAAQSYKQSKQQAKAVAREGALKAAEREKQTRSLAASQKTSFLSSGISLTGEDSDLPNVIMQDTFMTGIQDIDLIKSNYNQQSKNIMGAARAKLMGDIGGMVMGAASVSAMGGFKPTTFNPAGPMPSSATLAGSPFGGSAGLGSGTFVGGTGGMTSSSIGFI